MEDMSSDDPASQFMPIGSVFIAIAVIVWTSVALWLCYSGPPGNDSGDSEGNGKFGCGDLSTGAICKGFADLLYEGKEDKGLPSSQCEAQSLDPFKLEALLSKATGASGAKGLLNKVGAGGALKEGNGPLATGLSGLSLGGDKDGPTGCEPRTLPSPARAARDLEGRASRAASAIAALDDDVLGDRLLGDKSDLAGFREQLRDKLSASLNNAARKPTDPLDLGLASPARSSVMTEADALTGCRKPWSETTGNARREALEDFLKQLLHPPGSGLRGDEKGASASTSAARVRGKLQDGGDAEEKEVGGRPANMLSMAEHARDVGNRYLQDRHFAAATHCYEFACLLYPAGLSSTAAAGNAVTGASGTGAASALPGASGLTSGTGAGGASTGGSTGQLAGYHCNCALACLELGRYGDAINEGNAALVLNPPKHLAVKALYRLAVAHANLKNPYEARRCLKKCLDLDPLNEYVRAFLSRLGEEEVTCNGGLQRQLIWIDPPKRVQCLVAAARDKAKGKRAKQKNGVSAADEPGAASCTSGGLTGGSLPSNASGGGKDSPPSGAAKTSEVRLDREAGLWHSMARHNNKLYLLGGWSDGVAPPGALGSSTGAVPKSGDVTNGHGGDSSDPATHGSDELHVFDVDTFELRQLSGPNSKPPHPCYCHTATMVGSSMVVFGGCGPPSDQPALVMVFDVQQAKWRVPQTAGTPPRQRQGHSASAVQGDRHLCIFGGIEPTEQHRVARVYNDAYLLDLQSYAWRKVEVGGNRPPARFGHTATNLPGSSSKLLIVGGRDHLGGSAGPAVSPGFNGLHILDIERRAWSQQSFSGTPPAQAFYHSACVLDDTTILYLASGPPGSEIFNGRSTLLPLHLLDLEAWQWSSPHPSGLGPAPRIGHTAALVGNRVYTFGGVVMREGRPTADKGIYVLDVSQPRPAGSVRVPERDALQAPERQTSTSHVSPTHVAGKAERARAEKTKGDAAKATAAVPSSAMSSTTSAHAPTQAPVVGSPTGNAAVPARGVGGLRGAAAPLPAAVASSRGTAAVAPAASSRGTATPATAQSPAATPAAASSSAASSEAPPTKEESRERSDGGAKVVASVGGQPAKAVAAFGCQHAKAGVAVGGQHRAENGAMVAAGAKPTTAEVPGHAPPPVDSAATSSATSSAVPGSRARVSAGENNHHATSATSPCQPANGRSASSTGAGQPATAGSGRSGDDRMAKLLAGDLDDGDFDDDDGELTFEELLEQEKAYFKSQKKVTTVVLPKEHERGGGSGGGGKKGAKF